ncbi:MAG: aconitase family protein [Burkholderiaceae bacterium]
MTLLRFAPRFLFLATDPARVRAQLADAGPPLTLAQAQPLRDDVSTDEIIPLPAMVHFDATLGRYPYAGFEAGGERPIGRDAVRRAGIEVVVAGRRYGKGSSREHAVLAERSAGVRLVIAESFERIYRGNADNLGLLTSTDFGLVERIARGDVIALDELLAGRDALSAAVVRAGGLLRYGRETFNAPSPARAGEGWGEGGSASADNTGMPRTLFQKIIDRHTLPTADTPARLAPGQGGFVHADLRFIHEYYTGLCAQLLAGEFGAALQLHERATIVAFEDHLSYVHRSPVHIVQGLLPDVRRLSQAHRAFVQRHGLTHHGYQRALDAGDGANTGSEGISHAMVAERYALPGQLIAGTDSHTPHAGALGCVAFGIGTTDMANAFVTGAVRIVMPESIRIELRGTLAAGVTAKDVVLHLLALPAIRAGAGVGRVFEFTGPMVRGMSIDERATLTNMVAELGGFTGIVAPDAQTVAFLRERSGIEFTVEPWMTSDAGAPYAETIAIECSALSPMVAAPGDPGRGTPLATLAERPRIDIAYGGSCTAGKREDFDHYHAVLRWAADHGLRVAPGVKLYLQFGTVDVREHCIARGYLDAFERVGVELLQPACGACANCGPGASTDAGQVTVSAINRNFPGRSGPGAVWLASAPTVAASAIAGRLVSFDELKRGDGAQAQGIARAAS